MPPSQYVEASLTFIDDRHAVYRDQRQSTEIRTEVGRDELAVQTVEMMNRWIGEPAHRCKRDELVLLGQHLYRIAFGHSDNQDAQTPDRAFQLIYEYFSERAKQMPNLRLRLRLIFDPGVRRLGKLPWEFLFLPRGRDGVFLAGEKIELLLTRRVRDPILESIYPDADSGRDKLRILVVIANPKELGTTGHIEVTQAIESLQLAQTIKVRVERGATRESLRDLLQADEESFRPHIVHFIGHGRDGEIALVQPDQALVIERINAEEQRRPIRDADWVDAKTFCGLFASHKPRLVFLQACESATSDGLDTFSSAAQQLIYKDVPAVIAMQYEIEIEDANRFATAFYRKLRAGIGIDEAVAYARCELGQSVYSSDRQALSHRSFATPVIYLQTEAPIIEAPYDEPVRRGVACPWTACTGSVSQSDKKCNGCGRRVRPCPDCGRVIRDAPDTQCGCGYSLGGLQGERGPLTEAAVVRVAPDSVNPAARSMPAVAEPAPAAVVHHSDESLFGESYGDRKPA